MEPAERGKSKAGERIAVTRDQALIHLTSEGLILAKRMPQHQKNSEF